MHPLVRRPDRIITAPAARRSGGVSRPGLLARWWASLTARSDRGANLAEYGILLVLIAAVVIGIVANIGDTTSGTYSDVNAGFGS